MGSLKCFKLILGITRRYKMVQKHLATKNCQNTSRGFLGWDPRMLIDQSASQKDHCVSNVSSVCLLLVDQVSLGGSVLPSAMSSSSGSDSVQFCFTEHMKMWLNQCLILLRNGQRGKQDSKSIKFLAFSQS